MRGHIIRKNGEGNDVVARTYVRHWYTTNWEGETENKINKEGYSDFLRNSRTLFSIAI